VKNVRITLRNNFCDSIETDREDISNNEDRENVLSVVAKPPHIFKSLPKSQALDFSLGYWESKYSGSGDGYVP